MCWRSRGHDKPIAGENTERRRESGRWVQIVPETIISPYSLAPRASSTLNGTPPIRCVPAPPPSPTSCFISPGPENLLHSHMKEITNAALDARTLVSSTGFTAMETGFGRRSVNGWALSERGQLSHCEFCPSFSGLFVPTPFRSGAITIVLYTGAIVALSPGHCCASSRLTRRSFSPSNIQRLLIDTSRSAASPLHLYIIVAQ